MKKTMKIMAGLVLSLVSAGVYAQDSTKTPIPPTEQTPVVTQPPVTTTWDAKKNPTVDSITAPYKTKLIAARPAMTTEDIFPVLGKYESSANADAASVVVTLDPENKGVVWVEGLPQGKIKAMLRKSPATYKIPAQKTEDGKDVAEGTLLFDKDANTLNIAIGKTYNSEDPAAVFTTPVTEPVVETPVVKGKIAKTTKKKVVEPKAWMYTGTKVTQATASN